MNASAGQVPVGSGEARRTWDAIVVGAGPAGSTAAWHLARAGAAVLLLERAAFPRDKACGDLLIPDALAALERCGARGEVDQLGHRVDTLRVASPRGVTFDVPTEMVGLPRVQLDELLARRASEAGAHLARGKAGAVGLGADGPFVDLEVRPGQASLRVGGRFVLIATGADTSLLEPLGMLERTAPSAVALRRYVVSDTPLAQPLISFDRSVLPGYAWIFPVGPGRFNIGVGLFFEQARKQDVAGAAASLRDLLQRFEAHSPEARQLLAGGPEGAVRGARLRTGLEGTRPLHPSGKVLAVGETLGTTYPFTGEGIGKAMESAEIAAQVLGEELGRGDAGGGLGKATGVAGYAERIAGELGPRYGGYHTAQRWLRRAWVADLVSWRVARSPHLRTLAAEVLAERADPGRIFSLGTLFRSLIG
ncbi:MAG: geranylgeranyl reductase family protein [Gemmatimonadota bacterium]